MTLPLSDVSFPTGPTRIDHVMNGLAAVCCVWLLSFGSWLVLVAGVLSTLDLRPGMASTHPLWVDVVLFVASCGSLGGPVLGAITCWVVGFRIGERDRSLVPFALWTAAAGTVPFALLVLGAVALA